eukprot:Rmarinus@m.18430
MAVAEIRTLALQCGLDVNVLGATIEGRGLTDLKKATQCPQTGSETANSILWDLWNEKTNAVDLSSLGLTDKCLEALAKALEHVSVLRSLNLSYNCIREPSSGLRALTRALPPFSYQLTDLRIAYCQLGTSGDDIVCELIEAVAQDAWCLRTLHLQGNRLSERFATRAAVTLGSIPKLQTLQLQENKIGDEGFVRLTAELGASCNLTVLDVSENQISDIGFSRSAENLASIPSLQVFRIRGNRISSVSLRQCSEVAIARWCVIEVLDFAENRIDGEGGVALLNAIAHRIRLRVLLLDQNFLDGEFVQKLASVLPTLVALESLSLNSNPLGFTGVSALGPALSRSPNLQSLSLADAGVADDGALDLSVGIRSSRTLTDLSLAGNKIQNVGANSIADALSECHTLMQVILIGNPIHTNVERNIVARHPEIVMSASVLASMSSATLGGTCAGRFLFGGGGCGCVSSRYDVAGVAAVDKTIRQLKDEGTSFYEPTLAFFDVRMDDACCLALACALQPFYQRFYSRVPSNPAACIVTLSLSENEIGDDGLTHLAQVLPFLSSLEEISLSRNRIGDVGAAVLAEVIPKCKSLQKVYLWGNFISDAGALLLADATWKRKRLDFVHLHDNPISPSIRDALMSRKIIVRV